VPAFTTLALLKVAARLTTAVTGAGSALGYAAMAPQSQLFGPTFAFGANPKQIALTYDDGPNDPHTLRLLEVLAKHEVKATFFLIGRFVRERPAIAREIANAGHAIGNHTESHPNLLLASHKRVKQELADCERALEDAVGEHAKIFRPPYGARSPAVLGIARDHGLEPIMWSITCYDWKPAEADAIERHVAHKLEKQNSRGNIILMHDGGHNRMGEDRAHTVTATELLLSKYAQDFEFVTVPEMVSQTASSHARTTSMSN